MSGYHEIAYSKSLGEFYSSWRRFDCNDPGPAPCECDLNGDGSCERLDWLMFYPNWGKDDCQIHP